MRSATTKKADPVNDAGPKSVKEAELLDLRQLKFFGSKALCRFSSLDKACVSPSQEAYAAKANGLGWCDCEFARLKRTHVSSKLHQQENSERQLAVTPRTPCHSSTVSTTPCAGYFEGSERRGRSVEAQPHCSHVLEVGCEDFLCQICARPDPFLLA